MGIEGKIHEFIKEQRVMGKSTNYIVMSEVVYISFKAELRQMSFGILPSQDHDITTYKGMEIIRLDLPLDQEVLLVG